MRAFYLTLVIAALLYSCHPDDHLGYGSGHVEISEDLPPLWKLQNFSSHDIIVTSEPSGTYMSFIGRERDYWDMDYVIEDGCISWYSSGSNRSEVVINLPNWEVLGNFRSGDIKAEAPYFSSSIELLNDGSGCTEVYQINAEKVFFSSEGSGDVRASGRVRYADIVVDGSGDVLSQSLWSSSAIVSNYGSGDIRLSVENELSANINGSGDIYISGIPRVTLNDNGSGRLFVGN